MKIVIHEDALRELREANEWYASQGVPAKGQELMGLVDARIGGGSCAGVVSA
jgi:hypothetical protein